MSRMTRFGSPVAVQTVNSSIYYHPSFSAVTKPQSTFFRLNIWQSKNRICESPMPMVRRRNSIQPYRLQ